MNPVGRNILQVVSCAVVPSSSSFSKGPLAPRVSVSGGRKGEGVGHIRQAEAGQRIRRQQTYSQDSPVTQARSRTVLVGISHDQRGIIKLSLVPMLTLKFEIILEQK